MGRVHGIVMVSVFLLASLAQAEPSYQENFYRDRIEEKIAQCERKCDLAKSNAEHLRAAGIKARDQLIFLEKNKEGLIKEMTRQETQFNRNKVDYFIIKAYSEQTSELAKQMK